LPFLTTLLWFLVAISILVAIHEWGHFVVARRCGVRLLSFKDRQGTEFALSLIPLGGYVKMFDEREQVVDECEQVVDERERHLSYNQKTVIQRIGIAAAGPAANLILAMILFWAVFMNGTVVYKPVIGHVEPGSLAARAGLSEGQEIKIIDGQPIKSRRDVMMALINRLGETGSIEVTTTYSDSDQLYDSVIHIDSWMRGITEPDPVVGLGFGFYFPPIVSKVIEVIVPNSAADQAGFKVGDELFMVHDEDGQDIIVSWAEWVDLIRSHSEQPLDISVLRNQKPVRLTLIPTLGKDEYGQTIGVAGVGGKLSSMPEDMRYTQFYNPLQAFIKAANETKDAVSLVFVSIKKLLVAEISIKNLSGPIGIAKVAADQAKYGFWAFIGLLAQVSVMLGVLNILPIPVLDGGRIMYCLIEGIKGSPVSEKIQLWGLKAGISLMLSVMVVAFYNDILRF